MIDTATTSSLEQATTTVYAQGGKGYARLIAWEGEKTMTFTVTDALMSPMGLAVLTGAGLIKPTNDAPMHVHMTINKTLRDNKTKVTLDDLRAETGLESAESFAICNLSDLKPYATKLDGSGAGIGWFDKVTITDAADEFVTVTEETPAEFVVDGAGTCTVQLDFYLLMNNPNAVQEIDIAPDSFGGYFYVEAQTLFRREDSGKDMAAEIIIPKAKIQSAFTFTMAASGDPSTFDFVMDAMPGYTRFDKTKKLMCKIQILGTDSTTAEEAAHTHTKVPDPKSPVTSNEFLASAKGVVSTNLTSGSVAQGLADAKENQDKITVSGVENMVITVDGGINTLHDTVEPKAGWGVADWVLVDFNTGEDTIEGIKYTNRGTTVTLGADDIADAEAVGLGAGHLAVWVKAATAAATPATFTLEKDGKVINVSITAKNGAVG